MARCYRSCFALAREHALRSLAFPSISTGAYGFPIERAAPIALREIRQALAANAPLRVTVVLFGQRDLETYQACLEAAGRRR